MCSWQCVVHPDPGGTYVSLEQRSLGLWRFQTVWDIAKAAHRSRCNQVSVQMMDSVPASNGSFLLTFSCEEARILWPGVVKRHRPPAEGPPVDEGAVRVKGSGKKRFGSDLDFEGSSEEDENWDLVGGDVPYRHSKRGIDGR